MTHLVPVHLDDDTQAMLEAAARAKGVTLATYLRALATHEARRIRRERIRAQSRAVGAYVASSPEGQAFYVQWGTPNAESETGRMPRQASRPGRSSSSIGAVPYRRSPTSDPRRGRREYRSIQ
jgi:hypothetical protein